MRNSLKFLSFAILATTTLAIAAPAILFCPGTSQIIINDIYSGKARSVDGKWTGVSAIPPQYKYDWKTQVKSVYYNILGNGGYCQYIIGSAEAIDLQDNQFPTGYLLYDITQGTQWTSGCFDIGGNYEQTPTIPSTQNKCYYYSNPVFKHKK